MAAERGDVRVNFRSVAYREHIGDRPEVAPEMSLVARWLLVVSNDQRRVAEV